MLPLRDSDHQADIYARHGGHDALPKEPAFNSAPPGLPRGLVQALDGPDHARQRRIFAPAFSNTSLKKQESLILGHVQKLVSNIQQACDDGTDGCNYVNVADLFNFMAFDVMADLAFGRPLGLLDSMKYTPWVKGVFAVFRLLALRVVILFYLPQLRQVMVRMLSTKTTVERRKAYIDYAAGLVDQRLDQEGHTERPDIWTLVEKKQDVLSRPEMHINAAIFMAAGTETTATALCGATWYLTKNTDKMEIVTREVRGLAAEELTMETLAMLPYLNAVISESMRLFPPAPDMLYRLVPEGGAMVGGKHVPAGAVVGIHMWPAYHSARNFVRPEEFIPERWLPEEGEFANDDRRIVQPFSRGSRTCIGKNLALHEMRLALASILRQFDFFATNVSSDWMQQKSFIVWEKPPLIIGVKSVS